MTEFCFALWILTAVCMAVMDRRKRRLTVFSAMLIALWPLVLLAESLAQTIVEGAGDAETSPDDYEDPPYSPALRYFGD